MIIITSFDNLFKELPLLCFLSSLSWPRWQTAGVKQEGRKETVQVKTKHFQMSLSKQLCVTQINEIIYNVDKLQNASINKYLNLISFCLFLLILENIAVTLVFKKTIIFIASTKAVLQQRLISGQRQRFFRIWERTKGKYQNFLDFQKIFKD